MLEVRVLGPVDASVAGNVIAVSSRRQRALLAALVLARGRVASTDALVEALWDDDPPDGVRGTLQSYVSRLRSVLGSDAIVFEPGGYRLHAVTDLAAVEDLIERGRAQLDRDPAAAAASFEKALACWRGAPLGDLAEETWFLPDVTRLDELHRTLVDERAAALLALGRAAEVVPELEHAVAANPLRERTQLLLVETLAATGRAADALRAADRYRRRLADATGLDPTPALAAVEQRVLVGTATTTAPPRRAGTLPRPGALVGRDQDLERLRVLLDDERVVTVVGPGGIGKTRLVAELLHLQDLPCTVVEMAGVDGDDVAGVIAGAVGVTGAPPDPLAAAAEQLSVTSSRLVLDNVEHVAGPVVSAVRRLLDAAPGLRVLATSRARLGLPEEFVFPVGPLPADAPDSPAVALFLDRLRRASGGRTGGDSDVADAQVLSEALDGVPLALELAAARAAALGPGAVLARIDEVLDLVGSDTGRPPRHRTMRAVVGWSYELLSATDQELLDILGVFEGDLTVAAVEAVAPPAASEPTAAAVARLADASFLTPLADGRLRLLDTVRRFARERLESRPWVGGVRRAHAEWVATMLEEMAAAVAGTDDAAADARFRLHIDDVRGALRAVLAQPDAGFASRLARALSTMTVYRPDGELLAWARRAAAEAALTGADVRAAAARAAYLQGDLGAVKAYAEGVDAAVARHALGVVALYEGAHDAALAQFSAACEAQDATLAVRLDALGGSALGQCYTGDLDGARATLAAYRLLAESAGSNTYRAFGDYVGGELELAAGQDLRAVPLLESAVRRARSVRASFTVGVASTALLSALVRIGDVPASLRAAVDLVDHWWRTATWPQQWTTLRLAAGPLADAGRPDVALLVLDAAELDPAGPALFGADALRVETLRRRLGTELGADTAATVREVAAEVPRAAVVQRVRQVLTEAARNAGGA